MCMDLYTYCAYNNLSIHRKPTQNLYRNEFENNAQFSYVFRLTISRQPTIHYYILHFAQHGGYIAL